MQALSSDKFVDQIDRLHAANAKELAALKTQAWIEKSAKLLGLENPENVIGYTTVTDDPIARLNFPLVAKLNRGMALDVVASSLGNLSALPPVKQDEDFMAASAQLIQSAQTFSSVNSEFPGLKESWSAFFETIQAPIYTKLPTKIEDINRKTLFEALSSIVSGDVSATLGEYKPQLEQANRALYAGDPDELSDIIYEVIRKILDIDAPEPPDEGSSGGEGDEEGEEGGAGMDDAFADLAAFLDSQDPASMPKPKSLDAGKLFSVPDLPGIDVEKLKLLEDTRADMVMPEALAGRAYLTYKTAVAPGAREAYNAQIAALANPIKRVRNIIEEFYRTSTIIEYGQKSGRPDAARLHKTRFGSMNVFRRQHVDSVGHAHVVVLLDESGSMGSGIRSSGHKEMPAMSMRGLSSKFFSDDAESVLMGKAMSPIHTNRVAIAKNMALMLLEASRHLPGFKVEVAGYSSVNPNYLGPLTDVGHAVVDAYKGTSFRHSYYSYAPTVRLLGDTEEPYAVMSTAALQENADLQAFHWAQERLKNSSSTQRAILYLADGQIVDGENLVHKQLADARRNGISTFFMDLSNGLAARYNKGEDGKPNGLYTLPHQEVNTFDDMLKGLKRFLDDLVRAAG